MSDIKSALSIFAGVLFIAGFVPYIRAILAGTTKPAKASWIIWASLDTMTLIGMCVQKSVNGQIVGAVAGAWIVVILALKRGATGWTRLDNLCLAGAVLGIILWGAFNNPNLGIITSTSIVFIGSIPTFASSWKDPLKEDKLAWTIYWLSCVCAMLAIPKLTFEDVCQPLSFFLIESTMMFILYIKPRLMK